jgi:hypothetical protein
LWRLSDCEELVGVTHTEVMTVPFPSRSLSLYVPSNVDPSGLINVPFP